MVWKSGLINASDWNLARNEDAEDYLHLKAFSSSDDKQKTGDLGKQLSHNDSLSTAHAAQAPVGYCQPARVGNPALYNFPKLFLSGRKDSSSML